jgi:outer membrane protein assembly factor BamB
VKRRVLLSLVGLVFIASGCSGIGNHVLGEDNNEPPAELKSVESPLEIETVWSRDVGSGGGRGAFGLTPHLHGNTMFAADGDGDVTAFDATTGDVLWSVDIDLDLSGGPGSDGELVVVGSENGEVSALEASDGTIRWETRLSSEILAPPRVAQGMVLVRTVDGKLTALNASDGDLRWTYDRTVPVLTLRGTSPPVITDDMVISGFDGGRLVAVDLQDGQTVWERRVAIPSGRTELERLVDIDAEPQVRDGTVYVATFQGRVAAIDAANGEVIWRRDMSSHAGVGIDEDRVYVTDERSHVWALDRENSASVWRQKELEFRSATSPRRFGSHVVVADLEGYVHLLDEADGRISGRTRVGSAPVYAPPLVGDGLIYIYSSDGTLAALRAAQ